MRQIDKQDLKPEWTYKDPITAKMARKPWHFGMDFS